MEISELRLAVMCIEKGLCTREEFIDGRVIKDNDGRYFSDDDYRLLNDGRVVHYEQVSWCDKYENYYHEEDCRTVYVYRDTETWCLDAIERYNLVYYDSEYYDDDALDRHGIVYVEDLQEYGHIDDSFYCEADGSYYSYSRDTYVRGYHDGSYKSKYFDRKSEYLIGFEIEKEDSNVKESLCIDEFEEETHYKWRKEHDSSLCDESGFELISPTFEFDIEKIFKHIEDSFVLVDHINASYSTSCGGHIHLSKEGLSGNQMFDLVSGYTPLLYSLYYGRVDKTYSKGKSNKDLIEDNEKYQAIKIWHDRIEFRIISAVPNVKTLKWRCKLLDLMITYPTNDVRKAYYYIDTKFRDLLSEVYDDEDKMTTLVNRIKSNTLKFEDVDLSITKRQQTIRRNKAEKMRLKELEEFMNLQAKVVDGLLTSTSSLDYEAWAALRNATANQQ